jgi:signal transduction histidine kinase
MVEVCVDTEGQVLHLSIRDDGIGGADVSSRGSGLTGLCDCVGALGGTLSISSQPGAGTSLHARIPLERRRRRRGQSGCVMSHAALATVQSFHAATALAGGDLKPTAAQYD